MAEKTVINNPDATLQITFFIREGDSPFSYAEEKVVLDLDPGTKADIKMTPAKQYLAGGFFCSFGFRPGRRETQNTKHKQS